MVQSAAEMPERGASPTSILRLGAACFPLYRNFVLSLGLYTDITSHCPVTVVGRNSASDGRSQMIRQYMLIEYTSKLTASEFGCLWAGP